MQKDSIPKLKSSKGRFFAFLIHSAEANDINILILKTPELIKNDSDLEKAIEQINGFHNLWKMGKVAAGTSYAYEGLVD